MTSGLNPAKGPRVFLAPCERAIAGDPRSARKRLDLALMLFWLNEVTPAPAQCERPLREALRVVRMEPSSHLAHGLVGWLLWSSGKAQRAIYYLRRAADLRPKEIAYTVAFLAALAATRQEAELSRCMNKAARVHGIKLAGIRRQLLAHHMATDARTVLANAFPTIDWLRSLLAEEAKRVEHRVHQGKARAQENADLRRARRKPFGRRDVPGAFRPFVRLAQRWGLADDAIRCYGLSRITSAERAELRTKLRPDIRRAINTWLDSYPKGRTLPAAAGRFLYLLEAYDETFL